MLVNSHRPFGRYEPQNLDRFTPETVNQSPSVHLLLFKNRNKGHLSSKSGMEITEIHI